MRTIGNSSVWCQHPRMGRVEFEPNSLQVRHVVVTTEILHQEVTLPASFELDIDGIPVSYLALNDVCNVINELRTFPDIDDYLEARRTLPRRLLLTVGEEKPLFEYYLLNQSRFDGCCGHDDARIVAAARHLEIDAYNYFKPLRNRFAGYVECVSDRLAVRLEDYQRDLDPVIAKFYDDPRNRKSYRLMQDELCDLRLAERENLGMQLHRLREKVGSSKDNECMTYGAVFLDSKPDFVYVVMSARGVDRMELIKRATLLLGGAMTQYKKQRGMAIADREGKSFEVQLRVGGPPESVGKQLAEM